MTSAVPRRPVAVTLSAILALGFVTAFVVPYLTMTPDSYRVFWPRRWWLFAHLAFGSVALLVAPVQYWLGVTRKYLALHRVLGRIYLAAIALSSVAALGLAVKNDVSWVYGVGLVGLNLAWLLTTGLAWLTAVRRRFDQHREWMARSVVVTFAFVWFRAILGVTIALGVGTEADRFIVAAWGCWSVPLLVTEVWLQRGRISGAPAAA